LSLDGTVESVVEGTRLRLPARFRDVWDGQPLVVSKGRNSCLYVQTVAEYERMITVLSTASDSKVRTVRRFFASGAVELNPDTRGRLRIDRLLMEYADIQNRVVWRAVGDCLEVWDKAAFDSWTSC
jgi:MraZ protein